MTTQLMTIGSTHTPTMSSREIADVVESRHDNVKRTIERLADRGVIDLPPLEEYRDTLGRKASAYTIGKRDSYVIVAQLSPEFTARLVDRWQELEAQVAQPRVPQTLAEALRLAADQAEHIEKVEKERALAVQQKENLEKVVGTNRHSLSRFVRAFPKVNSMKIKSDLMAMQYLYMKGGTYRVYAPFGHLFEEKLDERYGSFEIYPTEKGKVLLAKLYAEGRLTLKK